MSHPKPVVGEWYRARTGDLFEVVAYDADDGSIELQYFDGTVEEMDVDDWNTEWEAGELEAAEAPEDSSGAVDVDYDDARSSDDVDDDRRLHAGPHEGLDIFEQN
jgi:hypothetical protein